MAEVLTFHLKVEAKTLTISKHISDSFHLFIASLFYHQVISYESEGTSEEDDLKLEAEVSEECIRLLELPGMVKAFNMNVDNLEAPPLIREAQKLLATYLRFTD